MAPHRLHERSPTTAMRADALEALSRDADTQTVVGTVLRELYLHHPAVRLDDVLELTVQVDREHPEGEATGTHSLESQVQHVLTRAVTQINKTVLVFRPA